MAKPWSALESLAASEIYQTCIKIFIFVPIVYFGMSAQCGIRIINNVIAYINMARKNIWVGHSWYKI